MKKSMAIIVSMVILFNMLMPVTLSAATNHKFHWASEELTKWSGYGIINGYTDGSLRPDNNITRAELLKVIDNLFKFTTGSSESVFSDVLSDAWFADVVNRATANGIINGYPDGTFRPHENVTREHAVLILFNAFKMSNSLNGSVVNSNTFSDSEKVSNYAKEAVEYFKYMGYINVYGDQSFKPQAYITRAEFIKIIDSIVDLYVYDDETSVEAKSVRNALITAANVSLKNVSVENALYISEAVGDSDIVLDSVKVNGITYFEGGGENSIHIIDSDMGIIIADKKSGEILRIVVEGSSSVASLVTKSSIIIEDATTNGQAIMKVTVSDQVPANTIIEMIGEFVELNSEADGINIILEGIIDTLVNNGLQLSVNDEEVEAGTNTSVEGTLVSEDSDDDSGNNSKNDSDDDSDDDSDNEGEEWTIYWNDEFNEDELDLTKWRYETGNWIVDADGNGISAGWGNNEKQYYTDSPNNIILSDGMLVLRALEEEVSDEFGTYQFTSGKLVTNDLFSKKYGKFEAKMKLPAGQGLWPAFWMMPDDDVYGGWAASGEIDIMEAAGSNPLRVGGAIHYGEAWPNNKYLSGDYEFPEGESITDFHIYSVEWEPGEIRWYVDGELYQTQNNWYSKGLGESINYSYPAPFDQEFYMILNLAVGGWYDGDPEDLSVIPAEVVVDYVRIYELTGSDYNQPTEPEYEFVELPADAKGELADGNLVYNNNYDGTNLGNLDYDGLYENIYTEDISGIESSKFWYFLDGASSGADFGGNGTINIDDTLGDLNYAKVDISDIGFQTYSVQLIQDVSLATGNYYTLSFDAKSAANRSITVNIAGDGNDGDAHGWSSYASETFNVTDEISSYEFTFQMIGDTDLDARLEFNLGLNAETVWLGNIRLESIEPPVIDENAAKEPLSNGNLIYNGTFDQGNMDRLTYWNLEVDEAEASIQVDEVTRELEVVIDNGGTIMSAVQVSQKGLQLEALSEYELKFEARAFKDRTIEVSIVNADGTVSYTDSQPITLTTQMSEYTYTFVMPDVSDTMGQLQFNMGEDDSNVYLDNVSMFKLDGTAGEGSTDEVTGGFPMMTFDTEEEAWSSWWGDEWSGFGSGTVSVTGSALVIDITGVGAAAYAPQVYYEGFALENGKTYTVSFDVNADEARTINVNIGKSLTSDPWFRAYDDTKVINVTTTSQAIAYTFTVDEETDENLKMVFELGTITDEGIATTLYFDNIAIVEDKEDPLNTMTFDSEDDIWSSWWGDEWAGFGSGDIAVTEGTLVVDITGVGAASYAPQIYYEGLGVENGKTYTVSFDVKADEARTMNVNIGKSLTSDPWFIAYAATELVEVTTEYQIYTYNFTVTEATDENLKMVFELGTIDGEGIATKLYFDNISIVEN